MKKLEIKENPLLKTDTDRIFGNQYEMMEKINEIIGFLQPVSEVREETLKTFCRDKQEIKRSDRGGAGKSAKSSTWASSYEYTDPDKKETYNAFVRGMVEIKKSEWEVIKKCLRYCWHRYFNHDRNGIHSALSPKDREIFVNLINEK